MADLRIAAIDLGSNSFHLVVASVRRDGSFTVLGTEKEMLRLGDPVSATGIIPDDLMDAAVSTISRFRQLADAQEVSEIVAFATSAIREADNGGELVDRIKVEADVVVDVISGRSEAGLIFKAIQKSVAIHQSPALCLDLGGGSLEVMVGDANKLSFGVSLKLGVARLAAELGFEDPLSEDDLKRLRRRIDRAVGAVEPQIALLEPKMLVATSGSFLQLARLLAADPDASSLNQFVAEFDAVDRLAEELIGINSAARRKIAALDAKRVDQIHVAAELLRRIMKMFGLQAVTFSDWALREGMLIDAVSHHQSEEFEASPTALREASVIDLAERCNTDLVHSRHVARFAVQLFDELRESLKLELADREILSNAALLHDIGMHVSQSSHHKHTSYLVLNGGLRGFSPDEIKLLACVARYHRRSEPKTEHEPFAWLSDRDQGRVVKLSSILRVADGLDRSHQQNVESISPVYQDGRLEIALRTNGDAEVEIWGTRRKCSPLRALIGEVDIGDDRESV